MLWMGFVFLMMLVNIAGMVFWIFMIIDAAKRKYKTENDQLLWILVVVLTGWIGALIYYFMVKRKEDKLNEDNK
ncbi:PLDc N-terminal domain-containing protein [Patescibacteria group bacterium]|nr:PLDc N-terminal domain-containing protein [Patescibacteria group bacterium]